VEARSHGEGIESVSLELRRLVPHQLTVRVPVSRPLPHPERTVRNGGMV
jgi:hypothetical protein